MSNNFQQLSYASVLQSFQAQGSFPAQTAFTHVRDSKDAMFASNLMPLPPKFTFQERTGRINWRLLMNTDLDRIQKEIDLKALETLLQNITFASLERDDLERLGDAHFIRLFRLSQYSIEYLLYTQNYLESLCKTLDAEYRQTYERSVKTEEMVKKSQAELKMMRKELKIKQKTLGTYEYLMKLPVDQEQEVIKCRHCSKFFQSKEYLRKHYHRHHSEIDFYRDFTDPHEHSLNDRAQSIIPQPPPQINQEELFDKIKGELFGTLTVNFQKLEGEITSLRDKQNYQQIQDMLKDYELKNEEEQRKIQTQLAKPAQMLEDLKSNWGQMFQSQTDSMKDMISQSVSEALSKRKEEREKKKGASQKMEQNEVIQEQKVKYFEQQINAFDEKFKENEKLKAALESKLKDYEAKLQEKAQAELELQRRLVEEEAKSKQEEKLRKDKEQELLQTLSQKAQEEMKAKLAAEELKREEVELLKKQEREGKRQEDEKQALALKKKQEEEQLKLEEQRKKDLDEQQKKDELKKKEEQEKLKKILEQEEAKVSAVLQEEGEEEEIIIEEEEEEEIDTELSQRKSLLKDQPHKPVDQPLKQAEPIKIAEPKDKRVLLKQTLAEHIKSDNLHEGSNALMKSFFPHPHDEVTSSLDEIAIKSCNMQDTLLEQEMQLQNIRVQNEKANPLTLTRKEDLRQVHGAILGMQRKDVQKVNNSLQKRLSDQSVGPLAGMLDAFLRRTLK